MDNPFRLHRPTSALGWLLYPARWVSWRLNKPTYDRLAAAFAGVTSLDQLWHLANYTRTHADNVHKLVNDQQGRVDELVHLGHYLRTHTDNLLALVRDAHTRCERLEESSGFQGRAIEAIKAETMSPLTVSPLMAQAITLDHVALARRIGMIESLLLELQAAPVPQAGDVLPLPAPRRLAS